MLGPRVDATTSAAERAEIEATANNLVTAPDISDLTTAEICTIRNFDVDALSASGLRLRPVQQAAGPKVDVVAQPPVPKAPKAGDRLGLRRRREDHRPAPRATWNAAARPRRKSRARTWTGSPFYDQGQFGFHAFEIVADDAMKQAKAADRARGRGASGPLLGIPIAIKNNYDTFDMATTNGSFTFEGFLPARDAFQVARLREAGAVIIGKTALEEYATFGHWSNDAWGQVWNVHLPSKSPLASSGGSAAPWPEASPPPRWDRRPATPSTRPRAGRAW